MSDQPSFFDGLPEPAFPRPVARRTDPSTSWEAARLTEPRAGTNRARALALLRERYPDGLTDYELADLTGLQQNSVGKRRGELRDAGLVRATNLQRRAPSGAWVIVWQAVPANELESPS